MAEPTKRQRRFRRLRQVCLALLALLLLALLLYPFWLVRVIRPVASHLGVRIELVTAQGYRQLRFEGIVWSNQTTMVRVTALEVEAPHRVFVGWIMRAPTSTQPQLRIEEWVVETRPAESPSAPAKTSTSAVLGTVRQGLPSWQRWLRHAQATDGELRLGDKSIPVPSILWRSGQLDVQAADAGLAADLTRMADGAATLTASNANGAIELVLNDAGRAWAFEGDLVWLSNRFDLHGEFAGDGLLPASARVESETLSFRPETVGLPGLEPLQGSVLLQWTNATYTLESVMAGNSIDQDNWLPEKIIIRLRGRGDLETLTVTRFAIESPFVNAVLEEPLTVAYGGRLLGQRTRLRLQADLGRMDTLPVTGLLSGHIDLEPVVYAPLRATFRLAGSDLDGFGVHATRIEVDGNLTWPLLHLTNVAARLEPGTELRAQLDLDLHQRRLNKMQWSLDGSWPAVALRGLSAAAIRGSGNAEGVWPLIHHEGQLEFKSPQVAGLHADQLSLDWAAERGEAERLRLEARSGDASLHLTGRGAVATGAESLKVALKFETLDFGSPAGSLNLAAPAELDFVRGPGTLSLALSEMRLEGAAQRLTAEAHIHWPRQGYARVEVEQLGHSIVQPFVMQTLPPVSFDHFRAEAGWTNGPLLFDMATHADFQRDDASSWTLNARARLDSDTMGITNTWLEMDGEWLASLSGNWPVRVEPALGREGLQFHSERFSRLDLDLNPGATFLDWLARRTGVRLDDPTVWVSLTNDHGMVNAGLVARARKVSLTDTNESGGVVVPEVERVVVAGMADLEAIRLTSATATSLGQPVSATGRYDIGAATWSDWWAAVREPDWNRLSGRLNIRHAEIAALSKFARGFVAPMGTIELELELEPGLKSRGSLSVSNAATRALAPVGALRDIRADIAFEGWDATIKDLHATLLGRPIASSGEVGWSPEGLRHMDVRVSGENLSLVHDPDMFIRADVKLHLLKLRDGAGRLGGDVTLRRSLLVRDFESFIALDRAEPERRPPWFNVPVEPFASWSLDVRVNGDRFLNVITPAFKGEVSAGLQLLGTLGEPFLVGAVTVDSGKLLFPFGQVALERGRVDFSREDPYRPNLDFRGEGQNFGYSITADLTGPMDSPNLTLQSVPPLTAQEILLMLSAGEIPRSDFGYTSEDKAGRIGYFVGKEFVNRFIGNTAATERLVLRSGEYITEDGGTTQMLEYKINDRLSVFGEYSRFQDFNSGLKVKVLSK